MITPLPFGEGKGEGPLTHRGISVITPLPFGGGVGGGASYLSDPASSPSLPLFPHQKKGTSIIAYPLLWLDSVRAWCATTE